MNEEMKQFAAYHMTEAIMHMKYTDGDAILEYVEEQFRLEGRELELRQIPSELAAMVALAVMLAPEIV